MRGNALVLVLVRSIRHDRNLIAEVATLSCEVRAFAQTLNPAQQELKVPVCGRGRVLRNL